MIARIISIAVVAVLAVVLLLLMAFLFLLVNKNLKGRKEDDHENKAEESEDEHDEDIEIQVQDYCIWDDRGEIFNVKYVGYLQHQVIVFNRSAFLSLNGNLPCVTSMVLVNSDTRTPFEKVSEIVEKNKKLHDITKFNIHFYEKLHHFKPSQTETEGATEEDNTNKNDLEPVRLQLQEGDTSKILCQGIAKDIENYIVTLEQESRYIKYDTDSNKNFTSIKPVLELSKPFFNNRDVPKPASMPVNEQLYFFHLKKHKSINGENHYFLRFFSTGQYVVNIASPDGPSTVLTMIETTGGLEERDKGVVLITM